MYIFYTACREKKIQIKVELLKLPKYILGSELFKHERWSRSGRTTKRVGGGGQPPDH